MMLQKCNQQQHTMVFNEWKITFFGFEECFNISYAKKLLKTTKRSSKKSMKLLLQWVYTLKNFKYFKFHSEKKKRKSSRFFPTSLILELTNPTGNHLERVLLPVSREIIFWYKHMWYQINEQAWRGYLGAVVLLLDCTFRFIAWNLAKITASFTTLCEHKKLMAVV